MAENSGIEWTDMTFNPWMGCTKVSPACASCYAERDFDHRYKKVNWGPSGDRRITSEANWRKPTKWSGVARGERNLWEIINETPGISTFAIGKEVQDPDVKPWLVSMRDRGVIVENERETGWIARGWSNPRVFCASLADVFEDWQGPMLDHNGNHLFWPEPGSEADISSSWATEQETSGDETPVTMNDVRRRLFTLIDKTPWIDWLLLTKRPENVRRMWPRKLDAHPSRQHMQGESAYRQNVWLGASVENQEWADRRMPDLTKCRDLSPVLFLSCEPLVGDVDLTRWMFDSNSAAMGDAAVYEDAPTHAINWVIAGGESGPNARPSHPDWFRSLRNQCDAANTPFFFKQWGEWAPHRLADESDLLDARKEVILRVDGSSTSGLLPYDGTDYVMKRIGKKVAGRVLDGRTHDGVPSSKEPVQ